MASITIARGAGYTDSLRAYTILLDGHPLGELTESEIRTFPIEPGQHRLEAKIAWCGSRPLAFTAAADDDVKFFVDSNLRGPKCGLVLFYIAFAWRSYLKLRQVPDLSGLVGQAKPIVLNGWSFILKRGVLGFAPFAWLLSMLWDYLKGEPISLSRALASLLIWMVTGVAWGAFMWRRFRRHYYAEIEARNARLSVPYTMPDGQHRSLRRRQ